MHGLTPRRGLRTALGIGALVVSLVGTAAAAGAADWSRQKTPTRNRILDVAFVNALVGVAVGQGGIILGTTDGGQTWTERFTPVNQADLRAITSLPNCDGPQTCFWAGTEDGRVIVSTDAGTSWCVQSTPTTEKINGLAALSADEVVVVATGGAILRSDAARECGAQAGYQAETSPTTRILEDIAVLPDGTTVVVGNTGTILRRTGTAPFEIVPSGTELDFESVTVTRGPGLTSHSVIAVGEKGIVAYSTDQGGTWSLRPSGSRFDLNDVAFPVNSRTGFIVGDTGTVLHTTDGGVTWTRKDSASCNNLFAVSMLNNETGWASGGGGTMVVHPATGDRDVAACALTGKGYRMVASDGGIFSFGEAQFYGSTGDIKLNQPIVGMAVTPTGEGYWLVASDGGIFAFGDAQFHGSTGDIKLNKPVVGMTPTESGEGYWLVASDGGVFAFGDAKFHGSTGDISLVSPIVGMAKTSSGDGYWMVAADGGMFSFGDAGFFGSAAESRVRDVVGMAALPSGKGYWVANSAGRVWSFGDAAPELGDLSGTPLAKPIVGIAATPSGEGYWLVATDGGIFSFGDGAFYGSTGDIKLNQPIVGMSAG